MGHDVNLLPDELSQQIIKTSLSTIDGPKTKSIVEWMEI